MSWVTNIILCHTNGESGLSNDGMAPIDFINQWLEGSNHHRLNPVDRHAFAGGKVLECSIHICAFNYIDIEEFLDNVSKADWKVPTAVQVFVQGQDDFLFTMYTLHEDRKWSVADPK